MNPLAMVIAQAAPKSSWLEMLPDLIREGPFGLVICILLVFGFLLRDELRGKKFVWFGILTLMAFILSLFYQYNVEGRKLNADKELSAAKNDNAALNKQNESIKQDRDAAKADAAAAKLAANSLREGIATYQNTVANSQANISGLQGRLANEQANYTRELEERETYYSGQRARWDERLKEKDQDYGDIIAKLKGKLDVAESRRKAAFTVARLLRERSDSYKSAKYAYLYSDIVSTSSGSKTDSGTAATITIEDWSPGRSVQGIFDDRKHPKVPFNGPMSSATGTFEWHTRRFQWTVSERSGVHISLSFTIQELDPDEESVEIRNTYDEAQ